MADEPTREAVEAFAAAAGEGQAPAEPAADTPPEEPQTYLGTYRDRQAAEAGLAEKDRLIGELGNRAGEAERRLQQLESQYQAQYQAPPAAYQQQDQGVPQLGQAEIMQVAQHIQTLKSQGDTEGALELQMNLDKALYEQRLSEMSTQMEQRITQLEAPVRQLAGDTAAKTAIDQAKALLGPNADQLLHDNKDAVLRAVEAMPGLFEDKTGGNQTLRADVLATLVLGSQARRENGGQTPPTQARNDAGQFVHVEPGSGAAPGTATTPRAEELDPDDPRRSFGKPPKQDAFGTIPEFAGNPYLQ